MASTKSAGGELKVKTESQEASSRASRPIKHSPSNPEAQEAPSSGFNERFDPDEYSLRKRLPPRFSNRKNDVYITNKTNFKAQLERCQKLLDNGHNEVFLHGLGNAINRAINLGLQIKRRGLGTLDLDVSTATIELTDDLEPLMDHLDFKAFVRFVSAIDIRIYRPENPVQDF